MNVNSTREKLKTAFVDDHRRMTKAYERLLTALQSNDFSAATKLALEIDKLAGPHIEFEENYLYPAVKLVRGEAYVAKLYEEHDQTVRAIWEIKALRPQTSPTADQMKRWIDRLTQGLDHAAACGSLLSHLQVQSPELQREYWDAIQRFRKRGIRWTELAHASKAVE